MKLTQRMKMTADLVPVCKSVIDVGTDHAYLPIYLCQNGIIKTAVASDISLGSAKKAKQNVAMASLENKIEIRNGNGLKVLKQNEYVNAIICAGMGGMLVIDILEGNKDAVKCADYLILQPQRHIDRVRSYIHKAGFKITAEDICFESGKYYFALQCTKGQDVPYREGDLLLGRFLPKVRNPLFKKYLTCQIASKSLSYQTALSQNPSASLDPLKKHIQLLKNAYNNMEEN